MVGSRVCMCAFGACVQWRSSKQWKKVSFTFNVYLRRRMWTNNELLIKSYDEQNERTTYVHIMRLAFVYIRLEKKKKLVFAYEKKTDIGMFSSLSSLSLCVHFFITIMLITGGVRKRNIQWTHLDNAFSFRFQRLTSKCWSTTRAVCLSKNTVHVCKTI